MNKHERYVEVCKQMELLGIVDVSTQRQKNNDTRAWRLPIKCGKDKFIEVASFATGYVRNQNSGYSNYQLNKRCMSEPQYYPEHKYNSISGMHDKTGKYLKYTTRGCKLIPNEIDRLEYLIAYCLKNYYIKNANQVAEGRYVSKWYHDYELERNQNKMEEICHVDANHAFVVNELQNKLANSVPKWKYDEANSTYGNNIGAMARIQDLEVEVELLQGDVRTQKQRGDGYKKGCSHKNQEINNLQNKLATIERIANDRNKWNG